MENFNALIVGTGIAGPVCAHFLARNGANVTMIERAPSLPKAGQGLDFEGPSKDIVRRMGVLDELKAKSTSESGFALVNDQGGNIATIGGGGPPSDDEIEVMRGDMVRIFCDAADRFKNVDIQYGRTVSKIHQKTDKVLVEFDDGTRSEFDAVIGADGLNSRTRRQVFGEAASKEALKPRNSYMAVFSMPAMEGDSPFIRLQHASKGRILFSRPLDKSRTSAYLMILGQSTELERALKEGPAEQKDVLRKMYSDVPGPHAARFLRSMDAADDFWAGQLAQVRMRSWSRGRCALIGDAAYAPTPLSGAGANLAIYGAYTLASELVQNPQDPAAAMQAYDRQLRTYVESAQHLFLGGIAQTLFQPRSKAGVWLVRNTFKAVAHLINPIVS